MMVNSLKSVSLYLIEDPNVGKFIYECPYRKRPIDALA